jgi:hypothetical protein
MSRKLVHRSMAAVSGIFSATLNGRLSMNSANKSASLRLLHPLPVRVREPDDRHDPTSRHVSAH